ncbi:monovalent cation/H+ antiporter subunit D family protein [Halobacteria archaeon AArc-m2/3/4]|uniref:Monovalent cation/H+ antiporter subunit D family protein n=1 Tax=Natronoglomus mannanivorans TaxID=2979990 RepID=A0AAP2Z002_9EURY|nr:monovalent cation/H+ antiporter subunit D family protein [Halobacteria archaeon AArc-xg1-1]MCU4974117.1 monovalent cation/H+ antiporter subunit D family protein [Halobacteria archaeon AArc-m2/3/4]
MSDALSEAIPVLLVAAPILAATLPLVFGLRFDRAGWLFTTLTTSSLFVATVVLATVVYSEGTVIHQLGGYPRAYGIELVADRLSTTIALLVTGTSAGVLAYTRLGGPRGNTFYSGYLLLVGGLLGLTFTGDVFNMFVFLEITGLATYALIASGDGPESAVAGLKYLIVGTVGASLYLLGVGLLFMATGTLNMIELAEAIPQAQGGYENTLVRAAFAFVFVGFAIKVAQWPVHAWQPDAYQHAPDGVTPLVAALVSTVSAYALARVMYTVFTVDFLTQTPYAREIVITVGAVSVVAGSTLAVIQRDVKRMLAYSSVSQFGLVVAAYGLVTETALVGAVIHLVGHGIMKAGLFIAAGVIALGYGARTVDEYAGLAARRPVVAGGMAVLLIALIGIPPSVGFVGKWYIALGAVQAEVWSVAAVIFLSTMLTLAYSARLLEKMYFTPANWLEDPHAPDADVVATDGGSGPGLTRQSDRARPDAVSIGMLSIVVVAAVLAVALGFSGDLFYDWLEPFVSEVFN